MNKKNNSYNLSFNLDILCLSFFFISHSRKINEILHYHHHPSLPPPSPSPPQPTPTPPTPESSPLPSSLSQYHGDLQEAILWVALYLYCSRYHSDLQEAIHVRREFGIDIDFLLVVVVVAKVMVVEFSFVQRNLFSAGSKVHHSTCLVLPWTHHSLVYN